MHKSSFISKVFAVSLVLLVTHRAAAQGVHSSARPPASCRAPRLRSAGYRDMLSRLPASYPALQRVAETSYRDASLRHPVPLAPASQRGPRSLARYVLKPATSCG